MTDAVPPACGAALLRLMWLASPALPVGGFSYSEGLESAVDAAWLATESEASHWLQDQLQLALARSELPLLAQAIRAWRSGDAIHLRELTDWHLQTRETAELRAQSEQMGYSLLQWLRNQRGAVDQEQIDQLSALPSCYPLAFALALAPLDVTLEQACLTYAWSWAENQVQAAIKSVPLGQSAGQRILAEMLAEIPDVVSQAIALPQEQWQSYTPGLAILSARHEVQYSRLFRS